MDFLLGILGGALATIAAEVFWKPIQTIGSRHQKKHRLRKLALQVVSNNFVLPRLLRKYPSLTRANEELTFQQFEQLLANDSDSPILVLISGSFGTGKSTIAKQLARLLATKHSTAGARIPILIDGSNIQSGRINLEICDQLRFSLPTVTEQDISQLLNSKQTVLILDAIDQIPSTDHGDTLADVLRFIESTKENKSLQAMVILLMRSEYLEGNIAMDDWIVTNQPMLFSPLEFDDSQLQAYFQSVKGPELGRAYFDAYSELLHKREDEQALLRRPALANRFANSDLNNLKQLAISDSSILAAIYRSSFNSMPIEHRAVAQNLAYKLYENQTFSISEAGLLNSPDFRSSVPSINRLTADAILLRKGRMIEFTHATFRDYFVADHFVDEIISGRGDQILSRRVIGYLISEFVSGLFPKEHINQLLRLLDPGNNVTTMLNVLDILAETKHPELREMIADQVRQRYHALDFNADPNEYMIFLASTAAVLGVPDAENHELMYLKRVGVENFLKVCFTTRDNFAYYGHQKDRFFVEWTKMIQQPHYGRYRCLMCLILAELKYARAKPAFQKILDSPTEDTVVQEYAQQALELLGNSVAETTGNRPVKADW